MEMEIVSWVITIITTLFEPLRNFLFRWQELVGALVGAAIPLSIFLLTRLYLDHKDYLEKVEKVLVLSINNLLEIDITIARFQKKKLALLIEEASKAPPNDYFLGRAFFPLMYAHEFPDDIINRSTGSNYLDNLIIFAHLRSKDLGKMLTDAQKQFEETYAMHLKMIEIKVHSAQPITTSAGKSLERNMREYNNFLKSDWSDINFPNYLRNLVEARATLTAYRKLGLVFGLARWRRRFAPVSFRYFKNYKAIRDFKNTAMGRIEKNLQPIVEKDLGDLLAEVKKEKEAI